MSNEVGDGIECPKCLDKIYSRHRHDFRYCSCKACFVDGGKDYLRYGFDGDSVRPKVVDKDGKYV